MRCQGAARPLVLLAAIAGAGVAACRAGRQAVDESESPRAASGATGLLGNAREAVAALLAVESEAGVSGWSDFRRRDWKLAGKGHTELGEVAHMAALKSLVRGLWRKASSGTSDEVTAADLDGAAALPSPADKKLTAEHWRVALAVIVDEIYHRSDKPLEPLAGKALEGLAGAARSLASELLVRSAALAGEAEIDGPHVTAAYRALAKELAIELEPRAARPVSSMDVARTLVPLTGELVLNKARALAASGKASGDLTRDLNAVAELPLTAEATELIRAAVYRFVARATAGIDPIYAGNYAGPDVELEGEPEGRPFVDDLWMRDAVQQVAPHRVLENGDIAVRLEPNPRPTTGVDAAPSRVAHELRLPGDLLQGVRDSAAPWRALSDALAARPSAIDPLAVEYLAEVAAIMIAASIERSVVQARSSGSRAIDAAVVARVLGPAYVQVPPRRPVVAARPGPAKFTALFADVTARSGLPKTIEAGGGDARLGGGGAAVGDVDRDGFPDLFLAGDGLGRLLLNRGKRRGLTFEDATEALGLPGDLGDSRAALLVDLEGDGDLDLVVLRGEHPSAIFVFDEGTFSDRSEALGFKTEPGAQAIAALDHDRDGDLDLYIGYRRGANQLWRNDGSLLVEVGVASKVASPARTMAVAAFDADMDGDLDLYVANELGPNAIYLNIGDGAFADVTRAFGGGDRGSGRGIAVSDVNGDGFWDLYVATIDMFNERLEVRALADGSIAGDLSGNKLYVSQADGGLLSEERARFGTGDRGWCWDALFADVDLDGDDDLYLVNGWAEGSIASAQKNQLFIRDGDGFFAAPPGGAERFAGNSRSVAAADFDRDGDIDLVVNQLRQPPVALEGQGRRAAPRNKWVAVSLRDSKAAGNPAGVGSLVQINTGAKTILRQVGGGRGYMAQSEAVVHAGVGAARTVSVKVRWPDGAETDHPGLPTNRAHVLTRPEGAASPGRVKQQ